MTIKLIRMSSGEDVIATVVGEVEDAIQIKNALVLVPAQNNQLGFAPWSPISDPQVEYIEVFKQFIVYVTVPQEAAIENYNMIFNSSNIVTPPEKKLIL
jgi:hypothetical protein